MKINYREFMEAVDKQIEAMTAEERGNWIHNFARSLQKEKRKEFLDTFTTKDIPLKEFITKEEWELFVREVVSGERCFTGSDYDEYGYYDNDAYFYSDPQGIGKTIERVYQQGLQLIDHRRYQEAAALLWELWNLEFIVEDENIGDSEIEITELAHQELLDLSLHDLILYLLYAIYFGTEGRDRTNKIYMILSAKKVTSIKLEDMLVKGTEEISDFSSFIEEWILYLKEISSDRSTKLLWEALLFQGDYLKRRGFLKEQARKHPKLYAYICECLISEASYEECITVAREGLEFIPEKMTVRAQVADLAVKALEKVDDRASRQYFYEEAFYSESNIYHFVRLFHLPECKESVERCFGYLETLPKKEGHRYDYTHSQYDENYFRKRQEPCFHFFTGDFSRVIDICNQDDVVLGWSGHIKGAVVPLFILLLNDRQQMSKVDEMLFQNICGHLAIRDEEMDSFKGYFIEWKEKTAVNKQQYDLIMRWTRTQVDKRTEAVVGGGYRHSYHKAAELIVALGDAMESRGNTGVKLELAEYYRKQHSRKTAFKSELQELLKLSQLHEK